MKTYQLHDGKLNEGFTLIEMMIVLGIIALLVGIGATMFTNIDEPANRQAAKAQLGTIETALRAYRLNTGVLPTNADGLKALVERPASLPANTYWKSLLKPSGIIDPWGSPYGYRNPGLRNTGGFDVYSIGGDHKEGTEDDVYNE